MRLPAFATRRRLSASPDDPTVRSAFCTAFADGHDGERAARKAGAGRREAAALAETLLAREAVWQEIEDRRAEARYADGSRYRPPPAPLFDALYYCCVQKSGSQWLKAVFQDPAFYAVTGLAVRPFVQLGHRQARLPRERPPGGTLLTHLYIDRQAYKALPKPARHAAFFVQRDPRDALVSWYHSARDSHVGVEPIPALRAELRDCGYLDGLLLMIERLDAWGYFDTLESWLAVPEGRGRFRYEDLADDEPAFLTALFDYLGVPMAAGEVAALAQRHAFERYSGGRGKGEENRSAHYRQGLAGRWRRDLPQAAVERLRLVTGDLVERLGYPAA